MGLKHDSCERHRGQLRGHCPQCYLEAQPKKKPWSRVSRPQAKNFRELDGYAPEDEVPEDIEDDEAPTPA